MKKQDYSNPLAEVINEIQASTDGLKGDEGIVDIMTFCNNPKYLNLPGNNFYLRMSQKIIIKSFYMGAKHNENLKLDKEEWEWLYEQEMDQEIDGVVYEKNIDEVIKKIRAREQGATDFTELHLVIGRRGSKCHEENQLIPTTEGSLTFRELFNRHNDGEKIGIETYDPKTLKRFTTYDIKLEENGSVDCFEIVTKRGSREVASYNHPYLVWRDDWEKPDFIPISEVREGDRIAVAKNTNLFGKGKIGVNKAALLGCFQGDGGTTHTVRFTNADSKIINEVKSLINTEFGKGKYTLKHIEGTYDYVIAKSSGRYQQDGSQKNEVKEWLVKEGCFGHKAIDKKIPESILKGSEEEVSVFLSRLFACDGWASTEKALRPQHSTPKSSIGYCSASIDLVNGIKHLLLKFGIHCVVSKIIAKNNGKEFDAWKLIIASKEDIFKFKDKINIFSKEAAVDSVCMMAKKRTISKGEFESVPRGVWNYINGMVRKRKLKFARLVGDGREGDRLRQQYAPSFRKIKYYGENIEDEFLKDMGSSDVKWDIVTEVNSKGVRPTIAMEVEGTNLIGTDFVSHNTIIASVICAYEVYKLMMIGGGDPHKYYNLPNDDVIALINVALSKDQAGRLFEQICSRLRNAPFFRGRIAKETASEIRLYTDSDLRKKDQEDLAISVHGSIMILCGHSNPDTLAGHNAILLLFDELAFYDEEGKVTGRYFYDRLTPSLSHFYDYGDAKIVQISSPSKMSGIFYDTFMDAKKYDHILSYQLPTWVANPTVDYNNPELVSKRERNPELFVVEYGAQWAKSGSLGLWFPEELVDRCTEIGITKGVMPLDRPDRGVVMTYYMHVDPAKSGDRYVALMVGRERYVSYQGKKRNRVRLVNMWIWDPKPGLGLIYTDIDRKMIDICSIFRPAVVSYDQYNSVHSLQLLKHHGINCIETTYNRSFKNKIYQNLREMMSYQPEPELWLYDDPKLILEMKSLRYRPTQRGIQFVKDKHGETKTDDVVDCLAGATAMANNAVYTALPEPVTVYTGWI